MRSSLLIAIVCLFAVSVSAQDPRGTITGLITDASQAAVPGVDVRATNVQTGVTATGTSNAAGNYSIPFLLPGSYRVSAAASGFKTFVREGIQVRVGETVEVRIPMEVGAVSETVEVKAETPLLDTAGASVGQVIDERRATELPMAGGNPLQLMLLTPGITEPSTFLWKAAWNFRQLPSDGNGATNNEFQIDGVSNTWADSTAGQSRYGFAPPQSAVSEYKVQTSPYDASYGHAIGAQVNVTTKGGTNELHGEAHWFIRNSAFNAADFFNNKNRVKAPVFQDNRYGLSAGGPVVLPKLYNGKSKTFWFYAYEGNKWGVPQPFTGSVPTGPERQGDFSALLNLGSRYQIYDPDTTAPAPGGRLSRQPFANNIIPANRLDPLALNLLKFYPLPNQTGTADGLNNYFNGAISAKESYFVHLLRIDHAFSDNHRVFLRLNYDWWEENKNHYYSNNAQGLILNRTNKDLAFDDVYVLAPSLILNVRYGLTFAIFPEQRTSTGTDLSSLGFSPQLIGLLRSTGLPPTLPRMQFRSYSGMATWESGDGAQSALTHSFSGNFNKLMGAHSLKFGADLRVYGSTGNRYPQSTAPDFSFGTAYTQGPLDNSPASPVGQDLASMLLGIPDGSMARTGSYVLQDRYLGLFVQDDYKITPRLTLNLGLRYEYEWPLTERFNRLVSGFAFNTANPIAAQAIANYANNPIPELPASQLRVNGGLMWVGQGGAGRSPFNGFGGGFLPRIGLAYQLTAKTTLRAGYGIFFDTVGVNSTSAIQTGFSQSTPIQASLDSGLHFVATTANPLPGGLIAPLGPAGGLSTNLGQAVSFYNPDRERPYSQRWSFGVQRLLPGQFLLDAEYVGNKAIRLPVTLQLNPTFRQYLSTLPTRDQNTINFLTAQFANPFYGLGPTYSTATNRAGLLTPYPEFSSVSEMYVPMGYSWYHALELRLEKRFSQGFTFQLGYTRSKAMSATSFLNPSDPAPYRSIDGFDYPQRLTMSGIWDLPFGKGRRYGSKLTGPAQFLLGGWQLDGIVMRQAGPPLGFGNAIFNGDLGAIPLAKDQRSVSQWFNVNAGFNRNSSQQLAYNIQTFPMRFSGVRADGRANWDFSTIKSFAIREAAKMQFRAECLNCFNHPNFRPPNTSPTSSAFGQVTGTSADPRSFQFSLKVMF